MTMESDFIALYSGDILETHGPSRCAGDSCCIHNPSNHPLRERPLNWRNDRGFMERICEHDIGHPDPDDIMVRLRSKTYGTHGCDGCC